MSILLRIHERVPTEEAGMARTGERGETCVASLSGLCLVILMVIEPCFWEGGSVWSLETSLLLLLLVLVRM
jgi:hypothetical protein